MVALKTSVERLNAGISNIGTVDALAVGTGLARVACPFFSRVIEDVGTPLVKEEYKIAYAGEFG